MQKPFEGRSAWRDAVMRILVFLPIMPVVAVANAANGL